MQERLDLQVLLVIDRGEAGNDRIIRDVLGDAGLCHDHRVLAQRDVAVESRHPADRDMVLKGHRPCEADQRGDGAVLAENAIMRNVRQIVDLGAGPDPRGSEGPARNTDIAEDLNVILDNDRADLRDLYIFPLVPDEPVTVNADPRPGMEDDPPADLNAVVDRNGRVDNAVVPDLDLFTDTNKGMDGHAFADPGAFGDHRRFVDPGLDPGFRRKMRKDPGHRQTRVLDQDRGLAFYRRR